MSDANAARAKGATRYDLLGMTAENFESMNARLIRLEFPTAFKPADTNDGGADSVLPREGGGYARCWQSKHFPKAINWTKCVESFNTAKRQWPGITEYTFCFPRELTVREQQTFDTHFRNSSPVAVDEATEDAEVRVDVDYWNGEELQARLTGSDGGQRVARAFFDDIELVRQEVLSNVVDDVA